MDVKLPIGEEDAGMSNPIKEEVKKDEMDLLKEEDIWMSRWERMNNALAAARTAEQQEPENLYVAASGLVNVIKGADVEKFISEIESLAPLTDLSATFNFQGLSRGSLLHIAAGIGKDDILRLLLDYVDDWGDTPLHMTAKAGASGAAAMLIRRARDLPNLVDKNLILRMKNKQGNTALHESVLNCDIKMVRLLLNEDMEPVHLKNADEESPLYLATNTKNPEIHEVLFSPSLEPSKIQGLAPIHGAAVHDNCGTYLNMLIGNIYV
ncbi:uncharacterized protein LOC115662835 [Syzygium oleosum]|uniref:uncharacterized protein LOC115662835 n=1 Tax=Syzygium oleosum TaxID=219896 RepID=UPI0011D27032|nr:uncharacterized protein LOC115662835 [Syzygium oleosum]